MTARASATIADVPESITLRSPAKINLHLRVAPPDASGFHPLRSWMITTTLVDKLTFTRTAGPLIFTCDDLRVPTDGTNLVCRAATALGITDGVTIQLSKRIPAGAGLGGGSGNAAATLVGLNRLLRLGRSMAELREIAATLGSDVPFFLGEPSAIATGRGERLEACPPPSISRHAVLFLPEFGVSTAAAYRMLDTLRPNASMDILTPFDAAAWSALPARSLLEQLVNDLELAAFALEPRLGELRLRIESTLGQPVRMSGSGSTLFTLFDTQAETLATAARLGKMADIRVVVVELGKPSGFSD